jgi:hypothetical protein
VEGVGGCTGAGGGQWVSTINLPATIPVPFLVYEVRWQATSLSPVDGLYLQLASSEFFGQNYDDVHDLIYATQWDTQGNQGILTLPVGQLLNPTPPKPTSDLGWGNNPGTAPEKLLDYTTNGFTNTLLPGQPFSLALRVNPHLGMSGLDRYSNVVHMLFGSAPPPSNLPPLASTYPSLYDVQILQDTYSPPQFLDPDMWGCVVIDSDPTNTYSPGQIVCPGKIGLTDDCGSTLESLCLLEGLGNAVGFVYDQFAFGYTVYKGYIATGIEDVIPGCSDSSGCQTIVQKGVDYGAAYVTGLPANMPSSDQLVGDSVADFIVNSAAEAEKSYTGLDVSAIESFCNEVADCKGKISGAISNQLQHARSLAAQSACVDPYEAYFHGQQPACLDPSIVAHAAPNSGNYPAAVIVRVTRKTTPDANAASSSDQGKYQVFVTATGEKWDHSVTNPLYQPAKISVPWMDPGQSIDLPAPLALLGNQGAVTQDIYLGSATHMKAVENCYSTGSSVDWVACLNGGQDSWDFPNPPSMDEIMNNPNWESQNPPPSIDATIVNPN